MPRLCLILLVCVACSDDPTSTGTTNVGSGDGSSTESTKNPPVSPAMGIARVQEFHKTYADLFADEEKKDEPNPVFLRQVVEGCEKLTIALEISITKETEKTAKLKHGRMRTELKTLRDRVSVAATEAGEIQTLLDEDAKGISPIPAGMTRAELEDRLADVREGRRKIDAQLKDHIADMTRLEKQINSGAALEPGDTMATRELEAVKELKRKAEALLGR